MIDKITLPCGVRILSERLEHVRSASVGIWVNSGSRGEKPHENGISHFIEHMAFKGTYNRSASEIAGIMDSIGGQVNAFTTKELTCFYARALDIHLKTALDVLCDIFFSMKIEAHDIETERGVILEEIGMYEDEPEDLVTERLFSGVYKGSPLAMPILGRPSVLNGLSPGKLRAYMNKNYRPEGTIVAISGCFSKNDIDYLKNRFSEMSGAGPRDILPAQFSPAFTVRRKPIEQNHICLGFKAPEAGSEDRRAAGILNLILGGGMSSRLYQKVREEHGLCYSIYSFTAAHMDTGILGVYSALSGSTEKKALRLIMEEIERLVCDGITDAELHRAREQIKAGILMGLESTNSRMNHLARSEMILGKIPSSKEIIMQYDAVTKDKVISLAREILNPKMMGFSAVGRVYSCPEYKHLLTRQ